MIQLTRLNGQGVVVNAHHISTIEATPDTLVSLHGGDKILVRESLDEVVELAVAFLRRASWIPTVIRNDDHTNSSLRGT